MKYRLLAAALLAAGLLAAGEAAAQSRPFGQEDSEVRTPRYQRAPQAAHRHRKHNHQHGHNHRHAQNDPIITMMDVSTIIADVIRKTVTSGMRIAWKPSICSASSRVPMCTIVAR
ncbi:MAG: hypothetical protein IPK23_10000 [Rhizobiales bacterium]|nr:hypothetical protein [Hyphomicrobiales bacterium]